MPLQKITDAQEEELLLLPESGMGYQIVMSGDAVMMVFNATIILPIAEFLERRFSEEDYILFSGSPDSDEIGELPDAQSEGPFEVVASDLNELTSQNVRHFYSVSSNVIQPPPTAFVGRRPYSFYRFSSFWRDKRVDRQGNFLPGTYATTYTDYRFSPSGYAAVGRYALPNPASARFVYQIVTFDRPSLMGTATPNFGQAGGGVEVLFNSGARLAPGASFMIEAG